MSRLAFVFRTDCHAADKSPASWKGDYPAEVFESLRQVGELARVHEANAVLDGGDFFHKKAPSQNSHGLIVQTALIHRAYPCKTFSVEGNHDMSANNLATMDRQPLGVLHKSGIFQPLREEVFRDGKDQVRVVGVPYSPFRTLEELRAIRKKSGDTHLLCVVHALAGLEPPGLVEDFFNEPVFRYSDLVAPDGPDVWMFGHWHKDQGIEVVGGKTFVNQGALSRGALVRENLTRIPKAGLIVVDGGKLTVSSLPLVVAPAEDVFDLERKERQEAEREDIDQFIQKLVEDADFDPEKSIRDNIASLAFADEVRAKALYYLELAEAG
jgi:DNA repair exonuclease SbcCD nuclease subunit